MFKPDGCNPPHSQKFQPHWPSAPSNSPGSSVAHILWPAVALLPPAPAPLRSTLQSKRYHLHRYRHSAPIPPHLSSWNHSKVTSHLTSALSNLSPPWWKSLITSTHMRKAGRRVLQICTLQVQKYLSHILLQFTSDTHKHFWSSWLKRGGEGTHAHACSLASSLNLIRQSSTGNFEIHIQQLLCPVLSSTLWMCEHDYSPHEK